MSHTKCYSAVVSIPAVYLEDPHFGFYFGDQLYWQIFYGFLQSLQENSGILPQKVGHYHILLHPGYFIIYDCSVISNLINL
jgi:hypothetical protein